MKFMRRKLCCDNSEGILSGMIPQWKSLSRRELARLLFSAAFGLKFISHAKAEPAILLQVDRLDKENPAGGAANARRQYRADAVILFLGMPIFRRPSVGGGYAVVDESAAQGVKRITLQFAAGSQPERAHGLNRIGFMKEVVVERETAPAEGAYFGFMASSPEESFDQAKRSLGPPEKNTMPYTAIDGANLAGKTRSALSYFHLPANYGWSQLRTLIDTARTSCHVGKPAWRETSWPTTQVGPMPLTFLYALNRAIRRPEATSEATYVYSEKKYTLQIQKVADEKQGQAFLQRGLAKQAAHVIKVKGKITNHANGGQTVFQLWMEETGQLSLPLRLEFQPRSFLRLAFEYDPKMTDGLASA